MIIYGIEIIRYKTCLEEENICRKIPEDIRRVWEHYPTSVNVNLG